MEDTEMKKPNLKFILIESEELDNQIKTFENIKTPTQFTNKTYEEGILDCLKWLKKSQEKYINIYNQYKEINK